MEEFTPDNLLHLKKLCRIELSPEEDTRILQGLKSIIAHAKELEAIDTEGVKPCNNVIPEVQNVRRSDTDVSTTDQKAFLANAPDQMGGMIKTPPVMNS